MIAIGIIIRNLPSLIAPTEPLNLLAFNLTSQELNVSWSEPERLNGILTHYTVYYKLLRNDKNEAVPGKAWETETIFSNRTNVVLKNLGKIFRLTFYLH